MSGLVAAHGPFDPRLGERMLARLDHRGPDGEGKRQLDHAWLGHQRLAVVDPAGGAQPLGDPESGLWLVGDGYISNYRRLRAEVGEAAFATGSDHEVALRLFEGGGVQALERLWGTYALTIAGADGRFVVTRDALGIAPLYWARRDRTAVFASELKAFDEDWLPAVEPFPPGCAWTPEEGVRRLGLSPLRSRVLMRNREPDEEPPEWVFDAIRDSVVRAVEGVVEAEVGVGAFLSGGLDSSVITAVAARLLDGRLPTFAAGLEGSRDLEAARLVAAHLGTDHQERVYDAEEAIALVPEVIRVLESFDPTLVHSTVPNHLVAAVAADQVKVVLIGEGADELFAGYSHWGELETGEELQRELLETIRGLHIGGLQRVDRVAGAHGLEARIPFLDLDLVELAMSLPPDWKLASEERAEKWLLRRAFDGWLPDEVLWRRKEQFGQGTGMNEVLRTHFDGQVSEEDLERERAALAPPIRTREELAYYRILTEHLPGVNAGKTIGRFVEA
jgi:asparagine synthase (glutamine-hydrolysing)